MFYHTFQYQAALSRSGYTNVGPAESYASYQSGIVLSNAKNLRIHGCFWFSHLLHLRLLEFLVGGSKNHSVFLGIHTVRAKKNLIFLFTALSVIQHYMDPDCTRDIVSNAHMLFRGKDSDL